MHITFANDADKNVPFSNGIKTFVCFLRRFIAVTESIF